MPVQDGDRVTAIDVTTGVETVVSIPPTDPNIRPIVLDENIGLVTLARLSELAPDGFLEPTSFFETTWIMSDMLDIPYISMLDEGDTMTYDYVPTTRFDPSLEYQVISSAGSGIADMTGSEERIRRGGVGGRGGGGGGGGSGQQQGQGQGGDEEPIEPFPPIQDTDDGECKECNGEGCEECDNGKPSTGQGEEQGSPSGSGQNQGPGMGEGQGDGSGETSGEGQGSGSGEGQGEGEGTGQGSGEGGKEKVKVKVAPLEVVKMKVRQCQTVKDNPYRKQQVKHQVEVLVVALRELDPDGPPGPPDEEENTLLEELLKEQAFRGEIQEQGEKADTLPGEFVDVDDDDDDDEIEDNYDDIFDESPDIEDVSPLVNHPDYENPDDFMDVIPEETPDRPFQDLSDEELQRMIDELLRQQEPAPGPSPTNMEIPMSGPNTQTPSSGTPETPASPDLDIPQGQSWMWINPVTGQLDSSVERPSVGVWIHVLFMTAPDGTNSTYIMTFDDLRRMMPNTGSRLMQIEYFQPVPSTLVMEFEEIEDFSLYVNSPQFNSYQDGYWEVITDAGALSITIQLMPNINVDGPANRWVPIGLEEDVSSDITQDINQEMQELLEKINSENELANEKGIPTGYGEGSTSPYVPDSESNAAAQQEAADAGAKAGKGDAGEARDGASSETNAARQEAQQAARDVNQTNDLEGAMEGAERAVENAMKANAMADPTNESDVSNRNQAMTAANDALDGIEEILTEEQMDEEIREIVEQTREGLNDLEIGEGSSLAQSFAEQAEEYRDEAVDAAQSETSDAGARANEAATNAVEAAVNARNAALQGDSDDREAVQQAQNMAQQAIDAAVEAGADPSADGVQQLLDQQPDFNDLGELSEEAEARNRDTLPGEFADVDNPEVTEDMMNVARRATEIAEEAMGQANPTNEGDMAAARYIQGQSNNAVDNVEGRWDGDAEEINELRQRIQDAAMELDRRAESMCALWNTNSQTWYRGIDGKILIFENVEDTLVYGVQKGLIEEDSPEVPPNWREIVVRPIGTGGEI